MRRRSKSVARRARGKSLRRRSRGRTRRRRVMRGGKSEECQCEIDMRSSGGLGRTVVNTTREQCDGGHTGETVHPLQAYGGADSVSWECYVED
jgi:hypothetical protein